MDWTQIEIKWAMMTRRVRSDWRAGDGTMELTRSTFPEAVSRPVASLSQRPVDTMANTAFDPGNS